MLCCTQKLVASISLSVSFESQLEESSEESSEFVPGVGAVRSKPLYQDCGIFALLAQKEHTSASPSAACQSLSFSMAVLL